MKIYINIVSNIINALVLSIPYIITSKILSPETMGEMTLYLTIGVTLGVIFNLGLPITFLISLQKGEYFNCNERLRASRTIFIVLFTIICIFNVKLAVSVTIAYLMFIKESVDSVLIVNNEFWKKLYISILDLLFIIAFSIFVYVGSSEFSVFNDFFSVIILLLTFKFILVSICIVFTRKFNVIFLSYSFMGFSEIVKLCKINIYNICNLLFSAIYLQGYIIVVGLMVGVYELSLIKSLALFQTAIAIVMNAYFQVINSKIINNSINGLSQKSIVVKSLLLQLILSILSVVFIIEFPILEYIFNITISDMWLLVPCFLLSFILVPVKIVFAQSITALGLHKERFKAIFLSTVLSSPILFFLNLNLLYLPVYILFQDLVVVILLKYKINSLLKVRI
ncbi:hypothetical protein AKG98_2303 [Moritella sp. JT01]|uniref:hypothetical protein n=1 Tax=Moritella sp. JT01 TaxID=756698 RepID=UPI0007970FCE|nr:hypothetical protein [Moritella sp. JT01]KXO13731.1 hypothetical protein AKG98_2303 [Moritella sp. JT01]